MPTSSPFAFMLAYTPNRIRVTIDSYPRGFRSPFIIPSAKTQLSFAQRWTAVVIPLGFADGCDEGGERSRGARPNAPWKPFDIASGKTHFAWPASMKGGQLFL